MAWDVCFCLEKDQSLSIRVLYLDQKIILAKAVELAAKLSSVMLLSDSALVELFPVVARGVGGNLIDVAHLAACGLAVGGLLILPTFGVITGMLAVETFLKCFLNKVLDANKNAKIFIFPFANLIEICWKSERWRSRVTHQNLLSIYFIKPNAQNLTGWDLFINIGECVTDKQKKYHNFFTPKMISQQPNGAKNVQLYHSRSARYSFSRWLSAAMSIANMSHFCCCLCAGQSMTAANCESSRHSKRLLKTHSIFWKGYKPGKKSSKTKKAILVICLLLLD